MFVFCFVLMIHESDFGFDSESRSYLDQTKQIEKPVNLDSLYCRLPWVLIMRLYLTFISSKRSSNKDMLIVFSLILSRLQIMLILKLIFAKSKLIVGRGGGSVHLNLRGFSLHRNRNVRNVRGGRIPADQNGISDDCDVNHVGYGRRISRKKCSHLVEKGNEEINSTVDLWWWCDGGDEWNEFPTYSCIPLFFTHLYRRYHWGNDLLPIEFFSVTSFHLILFLTN